MKNPIIILVIVAVVAILGVGAYTLSQNSSQSDSMMQKDDATMEKSESPEQEAMEKKEGEAMMEKTDDKMMRADSSRYVEYSKAVLDQSADKRRVLYFYATWCPSCKQANEDFTANPSKIPEDVVVIRTNYNDPNTDQEEKDLARKYGITYQHTFVQVDSAGKELTKWNGGDTDELVTNTK